MQAQRLFESVPNFSEGRRREVIDSIASAAAGFAHVLDVSSDTDHNRSVVSLVAFEEPLLES
ncbi:MAG TPA: glutamate formiminotransferase, partial [Candidatus Dormibacteraeota bacterium]|nr:glutamate formiminotransferase [Candidatus Dormibacteraeota bacterium]